MPHEMSPGKPTTRRYSEAEKDRAVRAVRQLRKELGTDHGGFIKVRLRATAAHYEAIGATVVLELPSGRRSAQVLSRGAGIASCQAPELVFGLGDAESATFRVLWPGGHEQAFGPISAGARVLFT